MTEAERIKYLRAVLVLIGLTFIFGWYLMAYYNQRRPHAANDGLSPAAKEEKLKSLSGNS